MRKKNFILKIVVFVIALYGSYITFIYLYQRNFIFPGRHIKKGETSHFINKNLTRIWLGTSVGRVEAFYLPAQFNKRNNGTAVIFAHGNNEIADFCVDFLKRYNDFRVSVLVIEYPGYGISDGYPSEENIKEAFNKGYDWLVQNRNIDKNKIFAHGFSLGGGVICSLARERKIRALILQSTFISISSMASGFLLPKCVFRDNFDNLSAVKAFKGPILIFHGKYDKIVPLANALELHRNSNDSKLILFDGNHNDLPADKENYWKNIRKFLLENGLISYSGLPIH